MIASLPMYDRAETAAANDRYWALIRAGLGERGIDAPMALHRGDGPLIDDWQRPDLVLSQTCGLPFRAVLSGRVALVGTPDFGVTGCAPGYYRSVLVVRADDPRDAPAALSGAAMAYNDGLSQSGWAAAQNWAAEMGLQFRAGPRTGSHRASAQMVATGGADFAALDAVTFALICDHDPDLAATLRVVGMTPPTPGLPYICAPGQDVGALRAAIEGAIPQLTAADRRTLRLRGLVQIPASAYLAIPTPPLP
ncbi:MAG: hypothetical protein EBU97_00195 [Rhodobacteraceae bacterium]|nr:hypothetical protein [Paracoccaceae bacterium]